MSTSRRAVKDRTLSMRLEEASLNAWPAVQQLDLDGWLLRFSDGVTKRANSVQALYGSTAPLAQKVRRCEAWYATMGRPCIFRLTPFSDEALDAYLAEREYRRVDPTAVLQRALDEASVTAGGDAELHFLTLQAWLAAYGRLSRLRHGPHSALRSILEAIAGERLLVALPSEGGRTVACGMGVLEGELFGLFNLVTDPEQRRRGHGARLVGAMLRWARGRGAKRAYLQVVRTNEPARRLYARLGFQYAYEYWYRVQPRGNADYVPGQAHAQAAGGPGGA